MNDMLSYEDDICILKLNQYYNGNCPYNHIFIYDYTDERLQKLRYICNLDSIAGHGSEFTKMLRITFEVARLLNLGVSTNINSFHAIEVLNKSKHGFKSNCFVTATVLTECFLSMGYIARVVRCMPIDLRFNECHCMTIAYVQDFNKFVAFDAAMGGCYIDSKGIPQGIADIRRNIIEGKEIHIRSIFNMQNKNIIAYLCKNMIRFQSHKISKYGNEIFNPSNTTCIVNLNPITIPLQNKNNSKNEHIYIYNDECFWENSNNFIKIL